jgi:hypothetical protein
MQFISLALECRTTFDIARFPEESARAAPGFLPFIALLSSNYF